ncbi:MAG: ABC transporter ATP-binding protein [Acidilobaceae archaeon]
MVLIVFNDVWKEYVMGRVRVWALRGVSFSVKRGEFIAIIGPSGSGKSTLIYLLSGIDRPSRGSIIIDGLEISKLGDGERARWRRNNVGIIFQFFHLIPTLTALENVILSMELANVKVKDKVGRAMELLEFVGLRDKADKFPWELSGGEQQRVAIARALANDPPIILADEPTAFLDRANKIKIVELLREANALGKTVIYTTHDQELAGYAYRRIRLLDGVLVGDLNE